MRSVRAAICWIGALLLVGCQGGVTTSPSPTIDPFLAQLAEGDAYAAAGERTAAAAAYLAAAETRPVDPTPHLRLAQLYLEWNRVTDGLAALEVAQELGARAAQVAPLQTALYAAQGDWERVTTHGTVALTIDPTDVATGHRVAQAAVAQGHVSEAKAVYEAILKVNPGDAVALERLGILRAISDPAAGHAHLQSAGTPLAADVTAALDEASDWTTGRRLTLLGQVCARHEAWYLAIVVLTQVLDYQPVQPEALALLGHAWDQVGWPEEAYSHLETAVDLAPGSSLARSLLGIHLLEQGDPSAARPHLEAAYELDPENPAFSLYLAHLYGNLGRYDAAFIWLDEATRLAPEDVAILEAVARFYLNHGLTTEERSLAAAEALIAAAPESANAHDVLGRVHHLQGSLDAAEGHLLRAAELTPREALLHYHLGQLYVDQDEAVKARRAFVRAFDLATDPALRGQIEETLSTLR
ncbi:MAG: tetratricopeptide repeat protein [Anaerolineae bacterium]|jgi:tetratricopeptide (TPR) repeat protein